MLVEGVAVDVKLHGLQLDSSSVGTVRACVDVLQKKILRWNLANLKY